MKIKLNINITLTRRRNESQDQTETGPLCASHEPAGDAAGADDPFPQASGVQAGLPRTYEARRVEIPTIAVNLCRVALVNGDQSAIVEQDMHLLRVLGREVTDAAWTLASDQLMDEHVGLWRTSTRDYQMTDDDVDYIVRCQEEDGE
jgi:hypothetical protein